MFKTLRATLAAIGAGLFLSVVPAMAVSAQDPSITTNLGCGVNLHVDNSGSCDTTQGTSKIQGIVTTVINLFSIIVGIVAVIMVIVGGLKYITSAGDSGKATSARNTIVFAVGGLVVVALAQFLVQFVLGQVNK